MHYDIKDVARAKLLLRKKTTESLRRRFKTRDGLSKAILDDVMKDPQFVKEITAALGIAAALNDDQN